MTESRLRNIGRIAEKAEAKLGGAASDAGSVPPRVAAKILEDGSWCDDEVMQEYLAGVLAGSRDETGRDDRGVYWADLVARLASHYVRVHYLIYRALRDHAKAGGVGLNMLEGQRQRSVYLPFAGLASSLSVTEEEARQIAHSVMPVLAREGLIGAEWASGPASQLRVPGAVEGGLHGFPTHPGIELYLWAHGSRATNFDVLMNPAYQLPDFSEHLEPVAGALICPI